MHTGDTLQTLLEQVDRILADSKPISANCAEVIAGGNTREWDIFCRAETFSQCGNDDCQMPICARHAKVCPNCATGFCQVCFQVHVC